MIASSQGGGIQHHVTPGVHHHVAALSDAERQAALHALSKITSKTGSIASTLGGLKQSATLIGGSVKSTGAGIPRLLHGSGSDTFIGGAHGAIGASIGNDTVTSGSTRSIGRGITRSDALGAHKAGSFPLSSDTINVAGATAASIKAVQPEDKAKAHTITLGDKTTVTISGLSTHDITKLQH